MKSMAGGIIQFFGDTEVMMSQYELKPLAVFADERPQVAAGRADRRGGRHRGAAERAVTCGAGCSQPKGAAR